MRSIHHIKPPLPQGEEQGDDGMDAVGRATQDAVAEGINTSSSGLTRSP